MSAIHLLSESMINQIAAGEVVERPLSIVKELVENSLDAGSSDIVVSLEKGGKSLISIKDNGCGMDEEDIFLSLERHATSKISEKSDLFAVKTKGFRGEALPSIAAVSRLSITSARDHGDGFSATFQGGELVSQSPAPSSRGTLIQVEKLFFNTPVRRKFLKSDEKELSLIREFIQKCAILYAPVSFTLIHNEKTLWRFSSHDSRMQRLLSIWKAGRDDIVSHTEENDLLTFSLYLGSPFGSFASTSLFAVNERIIHDRKINAVIYRVARETLGVERLSPIFLSLSLDPREVDVNVHPSKLEIRFRNEREVLKSIEDGVRKAVKKFRSAPPVMHDNSTGFNYRNIHQKSPSVTERFPQERFSSSDNKSQSHSMSTEPIFMKKPEENVQIEPQQELFSTKFSSYRIIGRAFNLYIILEMNDTLYFIDQHASHERIVYKKLLNSLERKSALSQITLAPELINLSPREMETFQSNHEIFSEAGFYLEIFDSDSISLKGVPAIGVECNWIMLIKQILEDITDKGFSSAWDEQFLSAVATRACHLSVKQNEELSDHEIEALILDINEQETLTCPHGRPFFHIITKRDLAKMVDRC